MIEIHLHPLERWRRESGLTQRDVAKKIFCTHPVISGAENGKPILRKYIERLVQLSGHRLKESDFNQASTKRKHNGKAGKKGSKQRRSAKGARSSR